MKYNKKVDFWLREDTLDLRQVKEVQKIVKIFNTNPGDILLDIGANVGGFSRPCAKAGAKVISVEPEPGNLQVLRQNLSEFETSEIIEAAVTDDEDLLKQGSIDFYLNTNQHKGLHSMVETRGRNKINVKAISYRKLVEEIRPTMLKIDIEHGEWFLDILPIPDSVRIFHIEMHFLTKKLGDIRTKGRNLHNEIIASGFDCIVEPKFDVMWGTHPIYQRKN